MTRVQILVLLLSCVSAQTASFAAEPPAPPGRREEAKTVAAGNNAFAAELYGKLRTEANGNLFFSPYSISTALAMVHAGAAGQTQTEIADVLHLTGSPAGVNAGYDGLTEHLRAGSKAGGYQLSVANALWGQRNYGFLTGYINALQQSYSANLFDVDFVSDAEASRRRINGWVAEHTKDKIKGLMPAGSINNLTRLVLTNAIYFKGDWASAFNKGSTRDLPFHTADGKQVTTPMMFQSRHYRYLAEQDYQAIALPYKNSELTMVALLPRAKDGLAAFEKNLTGDRLNDILKKLATANTPEVQTFIPKFKTSSAFSLNKTLSDLGMPRAFTKQADFSGINGKKDLYIQAAVHKAFVDVNEEGTEAAAATGIGIGATSAPPAPPVFKADHPFVFLIQDGATGAVLFMGRVTNPKDEGR